MIKREVETELKRLAKQFKAVAVVGPRQSGKTTLTRYIFKKKPYFNLENPTSEGLLLMIRGDSCLSMVQAP